MQHCLLQSRQVCTVCRLRYVRYVGMYVGMQVTNEANPNMQHCFCKVGRQQPWSLLYLKFCAVRFQKSSKLINPFTYLQWKKLCGLFDFCELHLGRFEFRYQPTEFRFGLMVQCSLHCQCNYHRAYSWIGLYQTR